MNHTDDDYDDDADEDADDGTKNNMSPTVGGGGET